MERSAFPTLNDEQWSALQRMSPILGQEGVAHLQGQDPRIQVDRIMTYLLQEQAIREQASALSQRTPSEKPLRLKVPTYTGAESESYLAWVREIELGMSTGQLRSHEAQVAYAINNLGGRAREWAVTCSTSIMDAFPTWEHLKNQMYVTFMPPYSAYRNRSRFLKLMQGKRPLRDYVQELRTLVAGMIADPLPEAVKVTVLMDGLRQRPAKDRLHESDPATMESSIQTALQLEYSHKQARSTAGGSAATGPEPMDLSAADMSSVRCYACGKPGHYQRNCPTRNGRRETRGRQNNRSNGGFRRYDPGRGPARGNAHTQ